MSNALQAAWVVAIYLFQRLAIILVGITALGLTGYWVACLVGTAPWLTVELRFGQFLLPEGGILIQSAMTLFSLTLLFYMPSHARMMTLERSHRSFHMNMRDVARAYMAAHTADREGVFTLSSEFDSIRDRIAFLRAHPDLDAMEADIMELAAQMSHVSRELAQTYSDKNVERARDFLIQRQEDLAEFEDRVRLAKNVTEELTRWTRRVELEESVAQSQLNQLKGELLDILPELVSQNEEQSDPAENTHRSEPPLQPEDRAPMAVPHKDPNDEPDLYSEDDRIVALLARRAPN